MELCKDLFVFVWTLLAPFIFTPNVSTEGSSIDSLATTTATVVRVVDGDTIVVSLAGQEERVRYIGINAPEIAHAADEISDCYGEEATLANERLVLGQTVTLVSDIRNRDQYNRLLRYVYANEQLVEAALVTGGYARAIAIKPDTREYKYLKALEQEAKTAARGLWSACTN